MHALCDSTQSKSASKTAPTFAWTQWVCDICQPNNPMCFKLNFAVTIRVAFAALTNSSSMIGAENNPAVLLNLSPNLSGCPTTQPQPHAREGNGVASPSKECCSGICEYTPPVREICVASAEVASTICQLRCQGFFCLVGLNRLVFQGQ
jgi:hypothetical protein